MNIWYLFLYQPLVNILMFVYQALGGNLGVAIIVTTALIRLLLIPLTAPGMKAAAKMQELKPELDKLKEKYKKDNQGLAQAQLELYRQHKINPLGSLLPTIIQFMLLIALFQAFSNTLKPLDGVGEINRVLYPFIALPANATLNTRFLYLDVTKPDMFNLPNPINIGPISLSQVPGLFLIGAVVVQFLSSKLMMGRVATKKQSDNKEIKKDNSSQEDMMMTMQKQMLILGPLMTLIIGVKFPSGMVLYWFVFSLTMIIQQWYTQKIALVKVDKN